MIGQQFGSLAVVKLHGKNKWGHTLWECSCKCGGKKIVKTGDLNYGGVVSCGCRNKQEGNGNWRGGKIEIKCAYPPCGKPKLVHPSQAKLYAKKYCDNKCRGAHRSEIIKGENNSRFKEKIKVPCAQCGNELEILPCMDRLYKNHFCAGGECFGKWKSENLKGPANSNFKGGTPEMRIIRARISASMRKAIRQGKGGRRWESLVEYNMSDLIDRLKATLPPGYSWEKDFIDGKGVLHIDHIRPMSSFSFGTAEDDDFKRCFAIGNLQLLPAIENMQKSAKYQQPLST